MKIFIIIVSLLLFIYLFCKVMVCFIFKKAVNTKWYYPLIPFYGLIKYLKFCGLPIKYLLVPFINILYIICSTSRLAKRFSCTRTVQTLTIFFPFIILPYIAFSKLQDKEKEIKFNYINNNKDVDKLEEKLEDEEKNIDLFNTQLIKTDDLIKTDYEEEQVYDENLILDEEVYSEDTSQTNSISDDEIIELKKEEIVDDLDYRKIETIEEKLEEENIKDKELEKEIFEFKNIEKSTESIAFGGEKQVDNTAKAIKEELKCKNCGSSLVGAKDYCPGCGTKI